MMPFLKFNLRNKLLIVVLFSQLIGLAVVGSLLYFQFQNFLYRQIHIQLRQTISISELLLDKSRVVAGDLVYLKAFVDGIALIIDCRVTIIDQTGDVLADSEVSVDEVSNLENHLNRDEVQKSIKDRWGFSIRRSKTLGRKLIYVSKLIPIDSDQHIFLRVSMFAEESEALLDNAKNSFFIGGVLVLIISSLLVIFATLSMNRTLRNIIESAEKIAEGNLETNINIRSNDELQDLGEILNEMSAELSDSIYKLMRQREDLNTVLSSINEGIIAIGPDSKIYFFNQIALRMLELNVSDVTGKHYADIFLNKHLNSLVASFFEKYLYLSDEIELHENKIMSVEINPFSVMETTNIGAVVVLRDVTNFKKLEQIRKEFVANVSHEFKNPLSSIQGYAETMLDWALNDPKVNRKYLQKIVQQSRNLENLVTDLLQLARVEGLQGLELQSFDPIPILKEVLFEFQEFAAEKKIEIKRNFPEESFFVVGDSEMFRTIFTNLIDNAIKYSSEGGQVILLAEMLNGYAYFSVKDNGIGIPQKYFQRIFERFFRIDKGRSRELGGTGLGLSIVKHMAELQNATYGVESEVDKGSLFWIKFERGNMKESI